jgi:hypothetical protein
MGKLIKLTGQKFDRLTVLGQNPVRSLSGSVRWDCICDCGIKSTVRGSELVNGNISSCGCLQKETATTHGMSYVPEYGLWNNMIQRCTNPESSNYSDYGGRGITVCERWLNSVGDFINDMGPRPSLDHTLDRRENDKGYYKENCRWATRVEQNNNRRNNVFYEYKGQKYTIPQLAELPVVIEKGISVTTLAARITRSKYSVEEALSKEVKIYSIPTYTHNGVTKTICEWAKEYKIDYHKFYRRLLRDKWDFDRAVNTP